MNLQKIGSLQEDVLLLFSSINDKRIENIFLKIADGSFFAIEKWIHQLDYDKIGISDPKTWVAFQSLYKLKKNHPSNFTTKTLMEFIFPSTKEDTKTVEAASLIPYLKIFSELKDDPELNVLFGAFNDILTVINSLSFQDTFNLNKAGIKNDLVKMATSLNNFSQKAIEPNFDATGDKVRTQKLSKKELILQIFRAMFKDISMEIISTLDGFPRNSWQSNVKKEVELGNLVKPEIIIKALYPVDLLARANMQAVVKVIKYITKNYKNDYSELLASLKDNALHISGVLSKKEIVSHHLEKMPNMLNILQNKPTHMEELTTHAMKDDHYLNKKLILFFSSFFYLFLEEIKTTA